MNFGVLLAEKLKELDKACDLGKDVLDNAYRKFESESVPEDEYKDALLIYGLLRDYLTLWRSGEF